ncbi:ATP-binding protein [Curvivirga sp.]|uniref:ATP-binding protein n=1 Tax=Curvivirga sp. TaxID=2856848 RepID=UPI003B5B0EA9
MKRVLSKSENTRPAKHSYWHDLLVLMGVISLCLAVGFFLHLEGTKYAVIFVVIASVFLGGLFFLFQNRRLSRELSQIQCELLLHNKQEEFFEFSFALENTKGQLEFVNDRFRELFFPVIEVLQRNIPNYEHRPFDLLEDSEVYDLDLKTVSLEELQARLDREGQLEFLIQSSHQLGHPRMLMRVSPFDDRGTLIWSCLPESKESQKYYNSRKRLDFLNEFMENAPFGLFSCNFDLILQEMNPSAREAFGEFYAKGSSCIEAFHPEDQTKLEDYLKQFFEDKNVPAHSIDVRMKNSMETVFSINVLRSVDSQKRDAELLVSMTDVTERMRLESQFTQSQKMQAVGQLAGGVAHDFNNMLTAIIGFCDLLLLRHRPGDASFVDTMQIKQNANRAAGLVRQLLAFSRREEVEPRNLNIVDIFSEISSLLNRLIGDNIELDVLHGRDLGRVKFDQVQFEQMIINLAVNARDAMPQGGRLSIQTDQFTAKKPYPIRDEIMPAGDYISISVADTGIGITKENLSKIFDPFFTTKDVGEGTGLGLSMVFGAVRQAKGYIYVHSSGENKGTTFVIYLPKIDASEEEMDDTLLEDIAEQDNTGGGSILLVEDEDAVRLFAARALRSKGYRVTEARSGEVALTLLEEQEEKFDLLVTDMMMPKVSGVEVIHVTRQRFPEIPVICISGYTRETVAADLSNLAHIYFLPKPFSLKQLATRVKEAVDSVETPDDDYKNLPLG